MSSQVGEAHELDPEVLLAKRRLLELQQKKLSALKSNGLLAYRPHPKQDAFHRAIKGDVKWRLWEAGNRSGKSTGGAAEDCAFLRGLREWYSEGDPARTSGIPQDRPLRGLVVCNDWKKVGEVFTSERGEEGKLWRMLPKGFVKRKRTNSEGVIDHLECQNGATLSFTTVRSWMTNPGSTESVAYDFFHFDEPLPQKMFISIKRGSIDKPGCQGWFTLTPKTEPWIHYMFFPGRKFKSDLVVQGRKWAQKGSTMDNPYLQQAEIEDFKEGMSRDEVDCLIHGIPLALSGLVYKEFNFDKHVLTEPLRGWKSFSEPPASATIYVAIDPHPQTPHMVTFLAVCAPDVWVVYDEIFLHCSITDLASQIKDRLGNLFAPCILCDPLAFIEHPDKRVPSYAEDFAAGGLYIRKASKDRSGGILRFKRRLTTPNAFYISPYCEQALHEFETHCWDEKENKAKDEDDHAMENLGRFALEGARWIDQEGNASSSISDIEILSPNLNLPDLSFD